MDDGMDGMADEWDDGLKDGWNMYYGQMGWKNGLVIGGGWMGWIIEDRMDGG